MILPRWQQQLGATRGSFVRAVVSSFCHLSALLLGNEGTTGVGFAAAAMSTSTLTSSAGGGARPAVIDSHLHVWANGADGASPGGKFPYATGQEPPASLRDEATYEKLLEKMDCAGVDGALIVQPINHKYDHSYVSAAVAEHPNRFKGMLLMDPSAEVDEALTQLDDLRSKGFVGVRFNPYLWPQVDDNKWKPMSEDGTAGLAVYRRCAELNMPVGIMCFKGLKLHYDDILSLLEKSPDTPVVLDHFGFTSVDDDDPDAFEKLVGLARYPNVNVKVSALFRLGDGHPYERVRRERILPLLEAYGPDRLMFGTDFPFILEQPGGYDAGAKAIVESWLDEEFGDDPAGRDAVMGGTAERLFGRWGDSAAASSSS